MVEMLEMRTSERKSLKTCPQQWWWSNIEGLRTPRSRNALWFGSAVHEALAAWYIPGTKRGVHPAETFVSVLEGERSILVDNDDDEMEYVNARELGVDMLNRYVEHYGQEEWKEYISAEYAGNVTFARHKREAFGTTIPPRKQWLRYHFTADGVYRDLRSGELWLDEHKTAASIWNDLLPLDDQAGSYWAIVPTILKRKGLLKPGEEIAGISYNFLRKAMGDTRPYILHENGAKLYTNTPQKVHYVAAINEQLSDPKFRSKKGSWLGPGLTGKETLSELSDIAMKLGIEVRGEISKSQPPPYFERFPVYRSVGERARMIERIRDEAMFAEAYRNGDLPIVKSPGLNCRMCDYRRMCELDEAGDQMSVEEFKETQYIVVDPYESYREHAE